MRLGFHCGTLCLRLMTKWGTRRGYLMYPCHQKWVGVWLDRILGPAAARACQGPGAAAGTGESGKGREDVNEGDQGVGLKQTSAKGPGASESLPYRRDLLTGITVANCLTRPSLGVSLRLGPWESQLRDFRPPQALSLPFFY